MIETACTAGANAVSNQEILAMVFFSVIGSVFICLAALTKIIWLAVQRHHKKSRLVQRVRRFWSKNSSRLFRLSIMLSIAIPIIAMSQPWRVFELRSFQQQIAQNAGNDDSDSRWTFGQIAAVTLMVPLWLSVASPGCTIEGRGVTSWAAKYHTPS